MALSDKCAIVDCTVILHRETEKALLVSDTEQTDPVWVPRSQIEITEMKQKQRGKPIIVLSMPDWLAQEKGLI